MSTWAKDFADNDLTEWTEQWNPANGSVAVASGIVTVTMTTAGKYAVKFTGASPTGAVELVAKVRSSSTASYQPWLILRGAASGVTGYVCGLYNGTKVLLYKYVGDSASLLTSGTDGASFTWSANTWYWIRCRIDGSACKVRIWADGSAEPSTWTKEDTDASPIADGWFGLGSFDTNGAKDFDFIGMADQGDTAPTTAVATTTYRPTSTVAAGGWTTAEASLHAALSDQNPATIVTGVGA